MAHTYSSYLALDQILDAQRTEPGGEHDEMLFIVIHQTYELWFKQILHETKKLDQSFDDDRLFSAEETLKRILTILKTLVKQVDILETLSPLSFAGFRQRLDTASGFQSFQFAQIEYYLGIKNLKKIDNYPTGSHEHQELCRARDQPSLYDRFIQTLFKAGLGPIPKYILQRDIRETYQGHSEIEDILYKIYKNQDPLVSMCERLIDLDEGLQEWRYRHIKMVERTIGMKVGTGGSAGSAYLIKTLFKPAFPDLWNVRSRF